MVTEFGKFLRKLRIDHGHVLFNMAQALGVTSSFLSAVENGKRPVPQGWPAKIALSYSLSDIQVQEMETAIWRSSNSVRIPLEDARAKPREAALAFARAFDEMDDETANTIHKFLLKQFDEEG